MVDRTATLEDFLGIESDSTKVYSKHKLYIQQNRKQAEYGPKKFIKP